MTNLKDIVFETDRYWVKRVPKGFEVYKTGLTHSTRVAVIGYTGDKGLERAKQEIARREATTTERHHATKKSSAQLDRDIAEALGTKPISRRKAVRHFSEWKDKRGGTHLAVTYEDLSSHAITPEALQSYRAREARGAGRRRR